MKRPRSKYCFIVTATAEDGAHPHFFYGLDATTANRAIAYASKQMGRVFCAEVPSEEWLCSHYLYSSQVDDFGRVITLEQSWENNEPRGVPMSAEQMQQASTDAAEYECLRSDGFDNRAPFPHASDPHWSDPRADFAHW